MLLSTSSFDAKRPHQWAALLLAVVLIAVALVVSYERYLRQQGYQPHVLDSPLLWSVQRDKANLPNALVFLGASRTQFGVDFATVRRLLPNYEPVMLAINGRYPLDTLGHLAHDPNFTGTVVLDIDARGLHPANHDAQQEYTQYYQQQWTPSWKLHRRLLTFWQSRAAMARPAHSVAAFTERAIAGKPGPFKFHSQIQADRTGFIDFTKVNPQDLADHFAQGLIDDLDKSPPPAASDWLKVGDKMVTWVQAIEQRGGKVLIYEPPVQGRQLSYADQAYPRNEYWDTLIAQYDLTALTFRDEPSLQAFHLADESHLAADDKPDYTRALVHALMAMQAVQPPKPTRR